MKTLFTLALLMLSALPTLAQSCCTNVVPAYPFGYVPSASEQSERTPMGTKRWQLAPASKTYDHKDHWFRVSDASTEGEDSRQEILRNAAAYHLSPRAVAALSHDRANVPSAYLSRSYHAESHAVVPFVRSTRFGSASKSSVPAVIKMPVSPPRSVPGATRGLSVWWLFGPLAGVMCLFALGVYRRRQFERGQEDLRRVQQLQRQNISFVASALPPDAGASSKS